MLKIVKLSTCHLKENENLTPIVVSLMHELGSQTKHEIALNIYDYSDSKRMWDHRNTINSKKTI